MESQEGLTQRLGARPGVTGETCRLPSPSDWAEPYELLDRTQRTGRRYPFLTVQTGDLCGNYVRLFRVCV